MKNVASADLVLCPSLGLVAQASRHGLLKAFDRVVVAFHFSVRRSHVVQGFTAYFCRSDKHGLMVGFNTLWIVLQKVVRVSSIVEDPYDHRIITCKRRQRPVEAREGFLVLLVINELYTLIEPCHILVRDGV